MYGKKLLFMLTLMYISVKLNSNINLFSTHDIFVHVCDGKSIG